MTDNSGQGAENYLLVQIDAHNYSLPVSGVERVVALHTDELSAVPFDGSGAIRGIFNHRGAVTVVINCKGLEAASLQRGDDALTAVILQSGGKRFAIIVDRAFAVARYTAGKEIIPLNPQRLYFGGADEVD